MLTTALPTRVWGGASSHPSSGRGSIDPVDPDTVRALALRAIDAARAAGADYADVKLTRTVEQTLDANTVNDQSETLAVGVRALAKGYWGFATSPFWTPDEVVKLATGAVQQAKTYALGVPKAVDLGHYPVATGIWTAPTRVDPFALSIEEKLDFMRSWITFANRSRRNVTADPGWVRMSFRRQERAVATTDGAYFTQTLFDTEGSFSITVQSADWRRPNSVRVEARGLQATQKGWELFLDARLRDQLPEMIAKGEERLATRVKPLEIGRFTVVFDGATMARLLNATIGPATELDRAMGYMANTLGTSYLSNPLEMLGSYHVGSSLVTVKGDRSLPGGLATVQWDDEGVVPDESTLVRNGILHDFQTTREMATWLAPWYRKQGRPVRSHGCAASNSAVDMTTLHIPNLTLAPASSGASWSELVSDIKRGVAVVEGDASADFQLRSGTGEGYLREIRNGKLGAAINGGGFLFDTASLWKNVVALGGARTAQSVPATDWKGQFGQVGRHTVTAVAGTITELAMVDLARRG